MMSDVAITLRHKVDEDSPFSDPNWRDNIVGISVTAQGFDELVAEDCAVNQFISVDHVIDDGRLHANIMQDYNIEVRETTKTTPALRRRHVTFDYSKLHQLVGRGHGERRGAVDASDGAPSTRTTVDHRTGLET